MGQAKNRRAEIAELKAVPKDTTGLHNHRLYHGTTETVARLIIDQGRTLQPRGTERESLYPTMPSRSLSCHMKGCRVFPIGISPPFPKEFTAMELIPIPGAELYYDPYVFQSEEATDLFATLLSKCAWERRKASFGHTVPREEAYYGDPGTHYTYSRGRLPYSCSADAACYRQHRGAPIPVWLVAYAPAGVGAVSGSRWSSGQPAARPEAFRSLTQTKGEPIVFVQRYGLKINAKSEILV